MKTRLTAIALVGMMIFGLGACGGKKPQQSSDKNITKVVVNGIEYQKSGNNFTHRYDKIGANDWGEGTQTGVPTWKIAPQITWVGQKIEPSDNVPQNFEDGVEYTVYAEDGSTLKFTVKATRQETL